MRLDGSRLARARNGHRLTSSAVAVHLRRVAHRQAELHPGPQGFSLGFRRLASSPIRQVPWPMVGTGPTSGRLKIRVPLSTNDAADAIHRPRQSAFKSGWSIATNGTAATAMAAAAKRNLIVTNAERPSSIFPLFRVLAHRSADLTCAHRPWRARMPDLVRGAQSASSGCGGCVGRSGAPARPARPAVTPVKNSTKPAGAR